MIASGPEVSTESIGEISLARARVEGRAVVEHDARAQADRVRELVLRNLRQRSRELRHDQELGIQVVELLADVQEDHASDEGSGQRRVESVRVLGEPDRQRAAILDRGAVASGAGADRTEREHHHPQAKREKHPRDTAAVHGSSPRRQKRLSEDIRPSFLNGSGA